MILLKDQTIVLGLLFAADSYRKCPLTLDHNTLIKLKNEIKTVNRGSENDGTAIGDGLITSINAIKNSNSKSKVIILLTDGVNNFGEFEPIDNSYSKRS